MITLCVASDVGLCMDMVRELRAYGCVQGTDFDFAYKPVSDGWDDLDKPAHSYVEFTFSTAFGEQCATLIGLKYGSR